MAKDPVCGMEVGESTNTHKSAYMGETHFFCSADCKNAFERNPEKYTTGFRRTVVARRKIVVVGTGEVGATFCFSLLMSGLATEIVLIDNNYERAEGHAMDLNHGLSFVQPVRIFAGNYSDCKDADIVVVTAGAAQKKGETRLELVQKNTDIFKDIIPKIAEHDPEIILVVSNPVDILTYAAYKISQYPMNRIMGSGTSLDTGRLRFLLSRHCSVDPRNVHAYIIGEHGDSEVPVWSQVNIAGVTLEDYCKSANQSCSTQEQTDIFQQVKNSAYEIINRKGYTNFAIALALVRILNAILRNENSVLTVSSLIDGYYGIKDVCLSIPCILNINGIYQHININLNEIEKQNLRNSADTLKKIIRQIAI